MSGAMPRRPEKTVATLLKSFNIAGSESVIRMMSSIRINLRLSRRHDRKSAAAVCGNSSPTNRSSNNSGAAVLRSIKPPTSCNLRDEPSKGSGRVIVSPRKSSEAKLRKMVKMLRCPPDVRQAVVRHLDFEHEPYCVGWRWQTMWLRSKATPAQPRWQNPLAFSTLVVLLPFPP